MDNNNDTYYDLTIKERDKFRKEFKKTPVGKDMFKEYKFVVFTTILVFVLSVVADFCSEELTITVDLKELLSFLDYAFWIMVITALAYSKWIDVNFTSWLKNKHNIKRW